MAIWEKLFSKITFKDYPDTSTPLNATNLNKMTDAIDRIDDRVVELNSNLDLLNYTFADVADLNDLKIQGFYTINSDNTTNIPGGASNFGVCIVIQMGGTSVNFLNQIWIDLNATVPTIYTRSYTSGTWREWTKLRDDANTKSITVAAKRHTTYTNLVQLGVIGVNANSRVFVSPKTDMPGYIKRVVSGSNVVQVVCSTTLAADTDYSFDVVIFN